MPTLADGNSSRPATHIGAPSVSSMRCASSSAAPSPSIRSTSTANSSPPRRETMSSPRTADTIRRPASTSSSSPAAWPKLSLTSLKRSRSRNSTANTGDRRCGRAIARCRRSSRRPVGQAGQRIVHGLVGQLLLDAHALADLLAQFGIGLRPARGCARSTRCSSSACAARSGPAPACAPGRCRCGRRRRSAVPGRAR
jgi:hypothetical protein